MLIVDSQFLPVAIHLLETAEKSIDISSFKLEWNDKPRGRQLCLFWGTLLDKVKNHIKLQILMNWNLERRAVPRTNVSAMLQLKKGGAHVKYLDKNRCCHAKIIIVDKKIAIVGSHNLSIRSCHANFETSVKINDIGAVRELSSIFDKSFYDAKSF